MSARLPKHVAVIMDGNGRWAKARGLSRSDGHKAGTRTAKAITTHASRLGIQSLTLYTFSRENWSRPETEVRFIFGLLVDFINEELPNLMRENIRLHIFGELDALPFAARQALRHGLNKTAANTGLNLNLALNYSSRDEIARAAAACVADGLTPDQVTPEAIGQRLYSAGQPDPDLLIRTSGEQRISNYLLYQIAYAELYFTDVAWPDFTEAHFDEALATYGSRERRFGGVTPSTGVQS